MTLHDPGGEMTEHDKNMMKTNIYDDLYGGRGGDSGLPKSDFPASENDPRKVYAAVHDELMLDGNARQNLATFCQTWEEPEEWQRAVSDRFALQGKG